MLTVVLEAGAVALVVALAASIMSEGRVRPLVGALASVLLGLAAGGLTAWAETSRVPPLELRDLDERPIEVTPEGYVGAGACRSCHPVQHATWSASYHRTMTQLVTPDTVTAPVDEVLTLDGVSWSLAWMDDELIATSEGVSRRVMISTGSHHAQDYWLETSEPGQELELFPFEYRMDLDRWLPKRETFLQPEGTGDHAVGAWNRNCIQCHTTVGQTWLVGDEETIASKVAAFGIACEACHGPGAEHVAAHREPIGRMLGGDTGTADPTIVNPSKVPHDRSAEICGQCHGIWLGGQGEYKPGEVLSEHRDYDVRTTLADDQEGLDSWFWTDGQVRVSGREYSGMLESPCFQRGEMDCLDCHAMHPEEDDTRPVELWADDQLLDIDEDEMCTNCHEMASGHSRHEPASDGARCQNCHAPYTTYGLLKAMRSHTVTSPSVTESLEFGRPNACNLCHLDRTLAWTSESLQAWAIEPVEVPAPHDEVAAAAVWSLTGDAGLRALMAWHLGWQPALRASGDDWPRMYLSVLAEDPYPAVRTIAERSLSSAGSKVPVSRPSVLVGEDGQMHGRFDELAAERDDRHMVLLE